MGTVTENEAIQQGRKGKKRTKLDELLHIDHSDVYFENDRLNDRLSRGLESMYKDQHRIYMQRHLEIKNLKKEIQEEQARQIANEEVNRITRRLMRPHTTGSRRHKIDPPKIVKLEVHVPMTVTEKNMLLTYDSDEDDDVFLPKNKKGKKQMKYFKLPIPRTQSAAEIKGGDTLVLKKVPADWYTSVIPPSDAIMTRTTRRNDAKSAPPNRLHKWDELVKNNVLRRRPGTGTRRKVMIANPPHADSDSDDGFSINGDDRAKSVSMSLRRMKEVAHSATSTDTVPSISSRALESRLNMHRKYCYYLQRRIKDFLVEWDYLKKMEREREERELAALIAKDSDDS